MCRPQILAVSDPIPPMGETSAWNAALLYRIVEWRYRDLKATWMTLNAESLEEAQHLTTPAVFDRLREGAIMIPCFWPSYRGRARGGEHSPTG
jgi:DNA replication protein DnaC